MFSTCFSGGKSLPMAEMGTGCLLYLLAATQVPLPWPAAPRAAQLVEPVSS